MSEEQQINQTQEPDESLPPSMPDPPHSGDRPSGGSGGTKVFLISCSMLAGLTAIVLIFMGIYVAGLLRNPDFKKLIHETVQEVQDATKCQTENLAEIAGALDRYRIAHKQQYPAKLEDLYPGFLKKAHFLTCPADTDRKSGTSYIYSRPTDKTPPSAKMVVCNRHSRGGIPITLVVHKDGSITLDTGNQGSAIRY